jgi:peptidoglycan/LPS O-acetylase OafA/YrhL
LKSERSEVIDLFKAFACVTIVLHHMALYGPMSDVVSEWLPNLIDFLEDHGLLAVQVFLVVGGYLNAKSWTRSLVETDFKFFSRALARYQRLVIPLLAALSFSVAVTAIVRPYFDHTSLSAEPAVSQVFAHVFLLQDVLYLEAFSAGVWYVAIDFQLFVMALACAGIAYQWQLKTQRGSVIRKALTLWSVLLLASLFYWNLNPLGEIWGTYFFSAYGLGLCVGCWREAHLKISHHMLAVMIFLLGLMAYVYQPRIRLLVAVLIAVLLALYESTGCRPLSFLKVRWIQSLSDASYAIFLVHFGVSLCVSATVFNLASESIPINAMGMLISFGLSLWVGRLLHLHVEKLNPSWKRWGQWVATFVATSTAVMYLA